MSKERIFISIFASIVLVLNFTPLPLKANAESITSTPEEHSGVEVEVAFVDSSEPQPAEHIKLAESKESPATVTEPKVATEAVAVQEKPPVIKKEEKKVEDVKVLKVSKPQKAKKKMRSAISKPSAEEYARIINLSGRQRMLSQKMSKESLFILAGIASERNRAELKKTLSLFKKTLEGLEKGNDELGLPSTNNKEIVAQLRKVSGLFDQLKSVFEKVISGEELTSTETQLLAEQNLALLSNSNDVVQMYVKDSGGKGNKAINLAGKQRMLSQKMAKEILLIYLDIDHDKNVEQLYKTEKLFMKTLYGLKNGDEDLGLSKSSNSEVNDQLEVVEQVWDFIYPTVDNIALMGRGGITHFELTTVDAFNIPLLQESNKAVKLLESSSN